MGLDASSLGLEVQLLVRLGIAVVLTGLLGWEREAVGKSAGVRTHILVGLGSAMFVGIGELLVEHFEQYTSSMQVDPTRILEAVATGVAFLGAGMIFVSRGSQNVHGLTTAASVWATAGVGMASGLGRYVLAMGTTAILLIVLRGLVYVERRVGLKDEGDDDQDPPEGGRGDQRTAQLDPRARRSDSHRA